MKHSNSFQVAFGKTSKRLNYYNRGTCSQLPPICMRSHFLSRTNGFVFFASIQDTRVMLFRWKMWVPHVSHVNTWAHRELVMLQIFENIWVCAMNINAMVEYMNLPNRIIQTYGPSHSPLWKTWQVGDVCCAQLQCQCDVICPPDLSSFLWNNTVVSHWH